MSRTHVAALAAALAASLVLALAAPARADDLVTVAVAELRATGLPPDQTWLGKSFADALLLRLSKQRAVRIVEREFLDQVVGELKLQGSAMVDEQSAVRAGRLLGAKVFVFGSIARLGDDLVVRARMVSVERGEVLSMVEATGSPSQVLAIQKDVASQVSSALMLQAALADGEGGLEMGEVTLAAFGDLDRLRVQAKALPFYGLSPARRRNTAEYQNALAQADRLLAQYPKLAPAHYYKALFSLQLEDFERADAESQAYVQLAPDDADGHLLRANLLDARGDANAAVAALKAAAAKFGDDARVFYMLGRVQAKLGDKSAAIASYLAAIERGPAINEAETNLATLLGGASGVSAVGALAAARPDLAPVARAARAFFAGEKVFLEDAQSAVRAAPRLYLAHDVLALAARAKGDNARAESELRVALALRPAAPEVHRDLGVLLLDTRRCAEGGEHVDLYLKNATAVDDFGPLRSRMASCHG